MPSTGKTDQPIAAGLAAPIVGALVALCAFVAVALWGLLIHFGDWRKASEFSTAASIIGVLFSGFALLGVLATLHLQREDLRLQRHELELTRDELAGQREELANQVALQRQERFETTLFQMLALLNELIRTMQGRPSAAEVQNGRSTFAVAAGEPTGRWVNAARAPGDAEGDLAECDAIFRDVCLSPQSDFGHFHRTLYHILRLIEHSQVGNRRDYGELLRAQLSTPLLTVVFFNCLSEVGRKKFKPLAEKYALFEHLPLHPKVLRLKEFYDRAAFGLASGSEQPG